MSGELLVWVEHEAGRPRKVALEALGKARALGGPAVGVVLGAGAGAVADSVAPYADRVLLVEAEALARYAADAHAAALAEVATRLGAAALLGGATFAGRELLPRVAARLSAAYLADCVDLGRDEGGLVGRRALYGGKAYAWLGAAAPGGGVVATVRPNAFGLPEAAAPAPVERLALEIPPPAGQVLEVRRGEAVRPELTEAEVVVAGGRGMAAPEAFAVVEALADALGGAVGASRAVVDAGWRPHDDQVGKSGKTVSPRLYVALGISGAIHHVMGMDTSSVIVAVNRDPSAPIFKVADYGLVGDAAEVAAALAARLREGLEP